jgi:hypothetical protein
MDAECSRCAVEAGLSFTRSREVELTLGQRTTTQTLPTARTLLSPKSMHRTQPRLTMFLYAPDPAVKETGHISLKTRIT